MRGRPALAAALAAAILAGCATVPTGPYASAMPGWRKSPEQFRSDDAACRAQAQAHVDPRAAQASNDAAAANVAGGTAIGAAVGALIGAAAGDAGAGAAIGAGTGLLAGSAAAANVTGHSSARMQAVYDRAYHECMYARGHRVPAPALAYRSPRGYRVPDPAPPAGGYPPRDAPPPPGYAPPSTQPPPAGFPPKDAPPPAR